MCQTNLAPLALCRKWLHRREGAGELLQRAGERETRSRSRHGELTVKYFYGSSFLISPLLIKYIYMELICLAVMFLGKYKCCLNCVYFVGSATFMYHRLVVGRWSAWTVSEQSDLSLRLTKCCEYHRREKQIQHTVLSVDSVPSLCS